MNVYRSFLVPLHGEGLHFFGDGFPLFDFQGVDDAADSSAQLLFHLLFVTPAAGGDLFGAVDLVDLAGGFWEGVEAAAIGGGDGFFFSSFN